MPAALALVLLVLALGYANGANDISKGIATLVGSGVANFRRAVAWGAFWTVAGGLVAAFTAQGLVATFSGKGFLAAPASGQGFLAAVSIGAIAWVAFASKTGLPVSTTHAIAGSLAGAGIVAQGASKLHWGFLVERIALPLAVSPLLSVVLLYAAFPFLRSGLSWVERHCVCLERGIVIQPGAGPGSPLPSALRVAADSAIIGEVERCVSSPAIAARVDLLEALHWLSSALTSFARGVNDTPKIVALGLAASSFFHLFGLPFYAAVAAGIGAGSMVSGFRVTRTLAHRVTRMSPSDGFLANLVTTALVGLASVRSLPVSTTHVSSGAIFGIGLRHEGRSPRAIRWKTVADIALSWLVTLPISGLVGAAACALLR